MAYIEYPECGRIVNTHGCHGGVKIESWCDTTKVKIERERERLGITNEDIVEKWNEIYQKSRERYDELIEEAERE